MENNTPGQDAAPIYGKHGTINCPDLDAKIHAYIQQCVQEFADTYALHTHAADRSRLRHALTIAADKAAYNPETGDRLPATTHLFQYIRCAINRELTEWHVQRKNLSPDA